MTEWPDNISSWTSEWEQYGDSDSDDDDPECWDHGTELGTDEESTQLSDERS